MWDSLTHPVLERLTIALLHFVWQGFAIAAVWKLAVYILREHLAQTRYLCGTAAMAAMVICPLVTFCLVEPSTTSTLSEAEMLALAEVTSYSEFIAAGGLNNTTTTDTTWAARLLPYQPYLIAAWLLGTVMLSVRLLLSYVGTLWLRSDSTPLGRELQKQVRRLSSKLGWSTLPIVVVSKRVTEAVTVGFIKPMVLIPAAWIAELSPEVLEAVIAHELAHIRRFDLWINLLQRMTETVLFYHPAVWVISNQVRIEREYCCDAIAVAITGQRVQYAQSLELVARRQTALPTTMPTSVSTALLATPFLGERKMTLLNRVRRVLGVRANAEGNRIWPVGLMLVALPLALVLISTGYVPWNNGQAVADDDRKSDRDRPEVKRDGDRPRPEGDRREGDRPRPDGPPPRDGDRPPRPGFGFGPPPPRDGGRPGFDGPPPREGERPPRPAMPSEEAMKNMSATEREMFKTIMTMRHEMDMMRRQMDDMRHHMDRMRQGPPPPHHDGGRPGFDGPPPPRDGGRPGFDGPPPRDGGRFGSPPRKSDGDRDQGEAKRDGDRKPEGKKPDAPKRPSFDDKD
ncbi:MAG: M56 family metallopeptidase [Pirellulales bacterium]